MKEENIIFCWLLNEALGTHGLEGQNLFDYLAETNPVIIFDDADILTNDIYLQQCKQTIQWLNLQQKTQILSCRSEYKEKVLQLKLWKTNIQ